MKILFIGRLESFKDPLTFCRAAHLCPNNEFILAGDGPLMEDCKKLAQPNLRILGWVDNVKPLLKEADIFVQCSPRENIWASSLIEAMQAGKAIIATDAGYTRKFLDGVVLLFPPRDHKALAQAIKRLTNKKLREHLGEEAMDYVKYNLAVDYLAREFIEILKDGN